MKKPEFHAPSVLAVIVFSALVAGAASPGVSAATSQNESASGSVTLEVATFAGGCFWCVESDFDGVPGVVRTVSGYTGGHVENPTYKQVSSDTTGHREAVQIFYDPGRIAYADLLEIFWRTVDPTDAGGQFCDRGTSYTTAIFANSDAQEKLAQASRSMLEKSAILDRPVVTTIERAGVFYPAEGYHQDYYRMNSLRYKFYRYSCGRDDRVNDLWGEQAFRGITAH